MLAGEYSKLKYEQKYAQVRIPEMMFLAEALANLKDWVDLCCSVSLSRKPAKHKIEKPHQFECNLKKLSGIVTGLLLGNPEDSKNLLIRL